MFKLTGNNAEKMFQVRLLINKNCKKDSDDVTKYEYRFKAVLYRLEKRYSRLAEKHDEYITYN